MLSINLRHLESREIHLKGELSVEELDFGVRDEMIRAGQPLRYDLRLEKVVHGILVQGKLQLTLDCQCVRCLKSFEQELNLEHWTRHLPLEGAEQVSVDNDCVDLTPFVREDMLLELPQHPLCKPDCDGLKTKVGRLKKITGANESSAWAELDKLKLKT